MLTMSDITFDDEFAALCPALTDDECNQLAANIERDGFRDPLVVWLNERILLDGHNRYEIWKTAYQADPDKEPEIVEKEFASRNEAKAWIIRNQFGRRNLTTIQRVELALALEPLIAESAKENQRAAGGAVPQKSAKAPVDTRAELAKTAGVSHDTIAKVKKINEKADPETLDKVRRGDVSINKAHKQVTATKSNTEPKDDFLTTAKREFKLAAGEIADLAASLKALSETPEGSFISKPTVRRLLKELREEITRGLPVSVCPKCKERGCMLCNETGYVPEHSSKKDEVTNTAKNDEVNSTAAP
jgi:hypothetical protein